MTDSPESENTAVGVLRERAVRSQITIARQVLTFDGFATAGAFQLVKLHADLPHNWITLFRFDPHVPTAIGARVGGGSGVLGFAAFEVCKSLFKRFDALWEGNQLFPDRQFIEDF